MSYILLQTSSQTNRIRRQRKKRVEPSSSSTANSAKSTGSNEHIERHQALVNTGQKKYFDESQQRYVFKEVSALDRSINEYESAYKALCLQNKYHALNEDMNRYHFADGLLWTIDNARLLKDSFGEMPQGRSIDRSSIMGARMVRTFSEPICSQLASSYLWNNVYQDIKFVTANSTLPLYDMLPPISHTMDFFNSTIQYVVSNICVLEANQTGLTGSDLETIQKRVFFYFQEAQFEELKAKNEAHQEMYRRQLSYAGHTMMGIHDPPPELMNILLETIVDNINLPRGSHLVKLWKCFLQFVIFEIATNKKFLQEFPDPINDVETDLVNDLKYFDINSSKSSRTNSVYTSSGTASLAPTMDSTGSRHTALDPLSEDYSKKRIQSICSDGTNHSIMSGTQQSNTLNDSSIQLSVDETIIEKPKKGLFSKFRKNK